MYKIKILATLGKTNTFSIQLTWLLKHIDKRFDELDQILNKRPTAKVVFPGTNADKHSLGTGIAADAWSSSENDYKKKYIASKIKQLQGKYGARIMFGSVGIKSLFKKSSPFLATHQGDPSLDLIHVWGANDGNWNIKNNTNDKTLGANQASVLKQVPGVFGIVTLFYDPINYQTLIMAKDVNLDDYK